MTAKRTLFLTTILLAFALGGCAPAAPAPEPTRIPHAGLAEARSRAKRLPLAPLPEAAALKPAPVTFFFPRFSSYEEPALKFAKPEETRQDGGRVTLSGQPYALETEHFRVHFTFSGRDAVPDADENGNDIPDFVEQVGSTLEFVWDVEINIFGWPAPPPDGGRGGDNRLDVYLSDIINRYGALGYVTNEGHDALVGDNPATEAVEQRAMSAFLVLDNDYQDDLLRPEDRARWLELLRSTASHEFLHVIQFGIDGGENDNWFFESVATWMEDEVYNDINDLVRYVGAAFKAPDSCQLARGGVTKEEDRLNWYARWLFFRFISERHGHATVRDIWLTAGHDQTNGYKAFAGPLATAETEILQVFREYSLALLLRDFEEGEDYPTVRLEGEAAADATFRPVDGVFQMGADYIEILADGRITVELKGAALDSALLEGLLVGVTRSQVQVFEMPDGRGSLDASTYEHVYLVVMNLGQAQHQRDCKEAGYTASVAGGGQAQEPIDLRARAFFEPPVVEGLKK
ncbi:MAG: hypothetical protein HYZ26_05190 [Chloroflexi bacterium]|nr:hypothetical protein [Chloroflexota bacterium]